MVWKFRKETKKKQLKEEKKQTRNQDNLKGRYKKTAMTCHQKTIGDQGGKKFAEEGWQHIKKLRFGYAP